MAESTSIDAYQEAAKAGLIGQRQLQVIDYLHAHSDHAVSQGEVGRFYSDASSSFQPRFRELEHSRVITCVGVGLDEVTGRHVKLYRLTGVIPDRPCRVEKINKVRVKVWRSSVAAGFFATESEAKSTGQSALVESTVIEATKV